MNASELSPLAKSLWGKKDNSGKESWLPLVIHLVDTGNTICWLYNHWLNEGQKSIIQGSLPEDEIQKLIRFLGMAHDIGKATPAFQTKSSYDHNEGLDNELIERLNREGFAELSKGALANPGKSPHSIAGEVLMRRWGLNDSVASLVGGHHGKPCDLPPIQQFIEYRANYQQADRNAEIQKPWETVQDELRDFILSCSGYSDVKEVPEITQPQAVLLEGLLIMADWLASCTYLNDDGSKPMFTLIPLDKGVDDIDTTQRFRTAISTWVENDQWVPEKITDIADYYRQMWDFDPRPTQEKMSSAIGHMVNPGISIVEAPMGIGKTEIALTAVQQLAFKTGRTGMYVGLPTQATTNAMFDRVTEWLQTISQEEGLKTNIKLMHGKAQFNENYTKLPKAQNITEGGSVTVNGWFSGKKSILADFSIGTIDGLLQMSLKQKHLVLKHLGFSGKIVVIDEVHAYDVYMQSYLKKALEWLGAYHVPVIALSATLPTEERKQLLEAYARGKYGKVDLQAENPDWSSNQGYPLLTLLDGQKVIQVDDFSVPDKTTKVAVTRLAGDEAAIAKKAVNLIRHGGCAGIIVNTVKRAQKIAAEIPDDIPTMILHSSFLATDRTKKEQELIKKIGKKGRRPDKLIVVGTQVLEQSLDIDFDVLITDIAPMDLLLQRVGRLHRHKINRPLDLENAQLFVTGIEPDGYGRANELIYSKYLLQKTDHFLPDTITLPTDISNLVQQVYSSKTDAEFADLTTAKEEFEDHQAVEKRKAKTFQIKPPKPKRDLHGWLKDSKIGVDKDDQMGEAAVRDITPTVEVILLKKADDGYLMLNGQPIKDFANEKINKEISQQVVRLPVAISEPLREVIPKLEELTYREFPEWQNSVWLRQSLVLLLDKNNATCFNDKWQINYSSKLGLSYEKEEEDG
ncbi:CRISPR-associated helicase Cas3' [Lactobacillus corticis]|uniref:CRISPR-associated helicase cas3 n=1 Tax=Lactobacillus corticis TaxID=2201249 RepID=A0A916QJC1_9LACO|nr:CRISPR-associated helicase Cas3' [Lactobacillus corticis]GFZ26136.1 CRISPR-associated helicase cas3 [Lactobacillus corticis]